MPMVNETLIDRLRRHFLPSNLKNKILYSSLAVILLVSFFIALMARYILINSLTRELELRGLGIARSIADRATGLILTQDHPNLVSLAFEAYLVGERKDLIAYIYILDTERHVLAHTFIRPFPEALVTANPIPDGKNYSVKVVKELNVSAYDLAVPVMEGIYDVGSVHVGLSKTHIDSVVGKLRLAFLGFIGGIIIIMFLISDKLSRTITRPISKLISMSDEISRDNLEFSMSYDERAGSEVLQLASSFKNMVRHLKNYRAELRQSQQKYRSLFHSGPDPIFVLDCATQEILDANPMAAELYGYPRKDLVGRSFKEIGEDSLPILRTFSSGDEESLAGCVFHPKAMHYKKSKEPFNVNVHACGTIYEDKPAIIVSTTDITDMVEKDAQLIQASKMKTLGEMSAGMAHELNQPLNAIKLGSEYLNVMAQRGVAPPRDKLRQVVAEISRQVDRAAEIINSLREFGRKSDITKDKFDINLACDGVVRILGHQLELDNIDLELDFAEDLPPILAHRNRLEQVLFNLLSNARDAINMDEHGDARRISLHSYQAGDYVVVDITDTGPGIPAENLDKIFEPFYTTKEVGKGMGLGLAISYGIIKDYQGSIHVESEQGKGTTFRLTFPAA